MLGVLQLYMPEMIPVAEATDLKKPNEVWSDSSGSNSSSDSDSDLEIVLIFTFRAVLFDIALDIS